MNRAIVGACVALAVTAGVGAQDKKMATEKMDHMAMEKTYSGCVESRQMGSYTLTHSTIAAKKSMKPAAGAMKNDDHMMKTDSMKKDDAMTRDAMMPAALALSAAPGVDLSKHVGHKVTVTGTDGDSIDGMATFKVNAVNLVGASCS
jgi:hypothetical protein